MATALAYLRYQPSDTEAEYFALNSLALKLLDERIGAGSDNLQLYLLKAEAYLAMGLFDEAQAVYEEVAESADLNEDIAYLANAHLWLGEIAASNFAETANTESILEHFQIAHDLYQELGEQSQVELLQRKIDSYQ